MHEYSGTALMKKKSRQTMEKPLVALMADHPQSNLTVRWLAGVIVYSRVAAQ